MQRATRIALIRHGQAQASIDRVVGGATGCSGLTALGRAQAEALRDRLHGTEELGGWTLLCSTLPRAIETAAIIAPAISDAEALQDCDLCELHPGTCDGMTFDEYEQRHGFDMREDPQRPIAPGGESLEAFQHRVVTAVQRVVAERAGTDVVIVCHGGFITAASRWLLGTKLMHERSVLQLEPTHTSITEWAITPERSRLDRYNDVAHLTAALRT